MLNNGLIEQITAALRTAFPPGTSGITRDVENNLRAALTSLFARLDLVTREEFEVQQAVLARTREMLEKLEKQVAQLEAAAKK